MASSSSSGRVNTAIPSRASIPVEQTLSPLEPFQKDPGERPVEAPPASFRVKKSARRLSEAQQIECLQEIARRLDEGRSPFEALSEVEQLTSHGGLALGLFAARLRVGAGWSLNQALAACPEVFPPALLGDWTAPSPSRPRQEEFALLLNAFMSERSFELALERKTSSAIRWLSGVGGLTLACLGAVVWSASGSFETRWPDFVPFLPEPTAWVLNASYFLREYSVESVIGAWFLGWTLAHLLQSKGLVRSTLFKVPLLGNVLRRIEAVRVLRRLSLALEAGTSDIDAVRALVESAEKTPSGLKTELQHAHALLADDISLGRALRESHIGIGQLSERLSTLKSKPTAADLRSLVEAAHLEVSRSSRRWATSISILAALVTLGGVGTIEWLLSLPTNPPPLP
jgi:type II secretory pathway component PulF